MLKTNPFESQFQALKRTKIIQNELIIRILHQLPRPIGIFWE